MHEASIVSDLIDLALRSAPSGARIVGLEVEVGVLTAVSPDAMLFYFEVLREESLGAAAQLTVTLVPLRGRCRACAAPFQVSQPIWSCPACGHSILAFENGDELDLKRLVIDDAQPDHDRAEDPQEERGHRG